MSEELKPCPFCGEQPVYQARQAARGHYWPDQIYHNCGLMMTQMLVRADSKQAVFKKWNTRTPPPTEEVSKE